MSDPVVKLLKEQGANMLNKNIVAYLSALGWYVRRVNTIHVRGRAMPADQQGYGDVQGCTDDGFCVNVEGKVGKDKLSEIQKKRIFELSRRGAFACAVGSIEELEKEIADWELQRGK